MLSFIAVFLLGVMLASIPLLIWYLHQLGKTYVEDCKAVRTGLEKTLSDLNQLHNNAMTVHKGLDLRVTKLETTNAAKNYGSKI